MSDGFEKYMAFENFRRSSGESIQDFTADNFETVQLSKGRTKPRGGGGSGGGRGGKRERESSNEQSQEKRRKNLIGKDGLVNKCLECAC